VLGVLGVVGVLVGLSPPQATRAKTIVKARMSASTLFMGILLSVFLSIIHPAKTGK
jgi:hypothetical protein